MATHRITFLPANRQVDVPTGTMVSEAIARAGLEVIQPCGGQGRCGRCAVVVQGSGARRRSTIRLTEEDLQGGYALACQTVIEGDLSIVIPEQQAVEGRLVTDRKAMEVQLPFAYDPARLQNVRLHKLSLPAPTIDDSTDDRSRLERGLLGLGFEEVQIPLGVMRRMGSVLREADWSPKVVVAQVGSDPKRGLLLDLSAEPIQPYGMALDVGTTTISIFVVDLESGEIVGSAAEYNAQIAFGEDVISRIIYASKGDGLQELSARVLGTIGRLLERLEQRSAVRPEQIYKAAVTGNTTMIHLLLQLPPASIRLTPYIPAVNQPPWQFAGEIGLPINPLAIVDCLPGVASYVGADISAGVIASGLAEEEQLTLFIDVGTNGEIVLGTGEWLATCACSAGPAFEGAGVVDGMRATRGAIEEVWVNTETFEPTYRVIGGGKPRGLCGSGLISILAELFVTGVIDRAGTVKLDLDTRRVRPGQHGPEYVVAWAEETEHGKDIVLTKVDVDNLMRAKAAIYAGFSVLASSVGLELSDVEQVLVGGSFGKYINVEKAIQIGLLPDLPWERFKFLGNTSVLGAYMALLSTTAREQVQAVARKMTYIELSADNQFYDAFTAALFLPHTDINRFPSVAEVWERPSPAGEGG